MPTDYSKIDDVLNSLDRRYTTLQDKISENVKVRELSLLAVELMKVRAFNPAPLPSHYEREVASRSQQYFSDRNKILQDKTREAQKRTGSPLVVVRSSPRNTLALLCRDQETIHANRILLERSVRRQNERRDDTRSPHFDRGQQPTY